jgi:hypothetical protein
MRTIDSSALDTLHLAANIGPEFMKDSSNKNVSEFFPILVWAIRDQNLDLVVNGKKASPSQYMEDVLSNEKPECQEIKKNFKRRKCFAFPQPIKDSDNLKGLQNVPESKLSQKFLQEIKRLLKLIEASKPKKIDGKPMTGNMFAIVFEDFQAAIDKKNVNVEGTYRLVETETNRDEFEKSISNFETEFQSKTQSLPGMNLSYYINNNVYFKSLSCPNVLFKLEMNA